jgi:hypothetical protein
MKTLSTKYLQEGEKMENEEILQDEMVDVKEETQEEINEISTAEIVKKEELERLINVMPIIKKSINTDVTVTLMDEDGVIVYVDHAQDFHMNSKVGDKMRSDDPVYEVIRTGRDSAFDLPEEMFGEPIYGKLVPIFSETSHKVIAVLTTAFSSRRQIKIENSTDNLNTSLEQTESTIEDFAGDIQNLANMISEIQNIARMVEDKVNEVSAFIATIKDNASTSKILALNASIEAARAGDAGKGFNVVASEMGKLAQSSGEMSVKISDSLNEMFKHLSLIATSVNGANEVATTQAATIEEITATLESITSESAVLAAMAKEV